MKEIAGGNILSTRSFSIFFIQIELMVVQHSLSFQLLFPKWEIAVQLKYNSFRTHSKLLNKVKVKLEMDYCA